MLKWSLNTELDGLCKDAVACRYLRAGTDDNDEILKFEQTVFS
jgi:hypothetical protein